MVRTDMDMAIMALTVSHRMATVTIIAELRLLPNIMVIMQTLRIMHTMKMK